MSWPQFWSRKGLVSLSLWPLSKLVCWEASRRLNRFRSQAPVKKSAATVIVVGNLVVGGSGKTPFIIWLAQALQAKGFKVGIISRGYGGQSDRWPQCVEEDSNPRQVGDEPLMLAKRLGCPVAVSPKRIEALQLLDQKSPCDVVISDDGLQHYALPRDIEVVLFDSIRGFGNRFCLPAGPLREPMQRLASVDFVVSNGEWPSIRRLKVDREKTFSMQLRPIEFCRVDDPQIRCDLNDFSGQEADAIAGIGNPQRFFDTLIDLNISCKGVAFADHHSYIEPDFDGFLPTKPLLMTEKDAVKCQPIAKRLERTNWWYLKIEPVCNEALVTKILQKISQAAKT
ncbi:tetraacyldisaccharide 4'-kinase [Thiomicrorhabdus sp.]|uniref:tetraacyldisaccharide 4'-kinase n=1 Tax=Thiomicrorhabdus sp. TaxID=2039724 RepID=UPI0029C65E8E|nr:tetraacyldisaccharide 4'-kinase [Thiomicrorhabdus sp.]